jgi:hypothetical protein
MTNMTPKNEIYSRMNVLTAPQYRINPYIECVREYTVTIERIIHATTLTCGWKPYYYETVNQNTNDAQGGLTAAHIRPRSPSSLFPYIPLVQPPPPQKVAVLGNLHSYWLAKTVCPRPDPCDWLTQHPEVVLHNRCISFSISLQHPLEPIQWPWRLR